MDPGPVHKRRRPAVACTECRRRKIACDLGNPCGPCVRSNANLRCVYNNYNPSRSKQNNNNNNNSNDNVYDKKSKHHRRISNVASESSQPAAASLGRSQYEFRTWPNEAQLAESQVAPGSSPTTSHIVIAPSKRLPALGIYEPVPEQPGMLSHTSLEQMTDTLEIEMQAFVSDGDLVFSEDGMLADTAMFDSSWLNAANPASSLPQQVGSTADLYNRRPGATAAIDNEPLEIHCDDVRALLRQVANKHDGGADEELLSTGGDHTLAQRLARTISSTEQQARQQQQPRQQELSITRSSLRYYGGQLSSTTHEVLPVKAVRDALLDAYFFAFESVIYILDPTSFLETCEGFWSRPRSQLTGDDDVVACKILVATSIGCCIHPNIAALEKGSLRTDEGLRCASEWLRQRTAEGCRLEPTDLAQILCLLTLAKHLQERRSGPGGAGRLLENYDPARVGMQLGFHREALSKNTALGSRDAETRRMLWATMVEFCVQVSLDEGLPPPIYPESYDCELPDTAIGATSSASSSIVGHLARTQRLRLQALHILNSPGSSATHEQCDQLATDIESACRESVDAIRTTRPDGSLTMYQIKSLEASIHPFILALHSKYTTKIPSNPEMYYSRCLRMECAARLLRHTLVHRQPSRETTTSHVRFQQQPVADELSMSRGSVSSPATAMRVLPKPRSNSKAAISLPSSSSSSSSSSSGLPSSTPGPLQAAQDPYISLCLRGHGHTLQAQRQATAMLFLDLIDDLDEGRFDIMHGAVRQELFALLSNALALFERRMRLALGAHSTREYVVFTSAAAYVDALLDRQGNTANGNGSSSAKEGDIGRAIAQAAMIALGVCSQVAQGVSFSREPP